MGRTVVAVLATAAVAAPGSAGAHPFGDPPTAEIAAAGDRGVRITWRAAPDDYRILGTSLGLISGTSTFVFDADGTMVAGPPPTGEQAAALADAPALVAYVRERTAITQGGRPCPPEVDTSGAVDEGVVVVATCPEEVGEVTVTLGLLHDLHPAYRTVARVDGDPSGAVFTAESPTVDVALTPVDAAATDGGTSAGGGTAGTGTAAGAGLPAALPLGIAGAVLAVGLIVVGLRRRVAP